jgi:hypothetical protein
MLTVQGNGQLKCHLNKKNNYNYLVSCFICVYKIISFLKEKYDFIRFIELSFVALYKSLSVQERDIVER